MDNDAIVKRFTALILPVLNDNGFELIKAEYVRESGNYFLRAYINREGGITINDCALVSRVMSKKMDKEDFIDEAYTMEICSPGFLDNNSCDDTASEDEISDDENGGNKENEH